MRRWNLCTSSQCEDVVTATETKDFVVVRNAPAYIAARLRISEKDFVIDHAQSLGFNVGNPWRSHPEKGLGKCQWGCAD